MMLPHSQSYSVQGHHQQMGMHGNSGFHGHGLQPSQSYAPAPPTLLTGQGAPLGAPPGMPHCPDPALHGMHHASSHLYTPSYVPPLGNNFGQERRWPMIGGMMGGGNYPFHAQHNAPANAYAAPKEQPAPVREIRECNDQCEGDQCGEEKCGGEKSGPNKETLFWGVDPRPFLPLLLGSSTVVGAVMMWFSSIPRVCAILGWESSGLYVFFGLLYASVIALMIYCSFCDPGEMSEADEKDALTAAALMSCESFSDGGDEEPGKPRLKLPRRAKIMWQYRRAILRYDHYCKWLVNAIGLYNHRQFFAMVSGLVAVGILGAVLDTFLLYSLVTKNLNGDIVSGLMNDITGLIFSVLHLGYSVCLTHKIYNIFETHVGLISRNETADEWKREVHSYVPKSRKGDNIPVDELSEDEHNALFSEFLYDSKRNPFDKGLVKNLRIFWFTSRWSKDQKGEF